MYQSGELKHKIGFEIDSKSWNNLNKFQKRLADVKAQMKGIQSLQLKVSGSVSKVQAVRNSVAKQQAALGINRDYTESLAARRIRTEYRLTKAGLPLNQIQQGMKDFDALAASVSKGSMSLQRFNAQSSVMTSKVIDQHRNTRQASTSMATYASRATAVTAALVATTAAATASSIAILNTGKSIESLRAGMTMVFGEGKAREEIQWIGKEANRMGVDFLEAADSYKKLSVSLQGKMSHSQIQDLFVGVSEYSTAMQITKEQQQGVFRALNQMSSKGQIMASELKEQMGEHLPGAVRIFAEALGITEAQMFKQMEQGKLMADKVLPLVAKRFKEAANTNNAFAIASKKVSAEQNRMNNAFAETKALMFDAGVGSAFAGLFNSITQALKENSKFFEYWGKDLAAFIDNMKVLVNLISSAMKEYSELRGWTEQAQTNPQGFAQQAYGAVSGFSAPDFGKLTMVNPLVSMASNLASTWTRSAENTQRVQVEVQSTVKVNDGAVKGLVRNELREYDANNKAAILAEGSR